MNTKIINKLKEETNNSSYIVYREKYINNFVGCRNSIAHGEGREVSKEEFYDYLEGIKNLLTLYKEKLLDCGKPK